MKLLKISSIALATTVLSTAVLFASACGGGGGIDLPGKIPGSSSGGGGDSDTNLEGNIVLRLERQEVSVGNFTQVFVQIDEMNQSGVLLKVRYPLSLRYSKRSAVIFPGESEEAFISPFMEATAGEHRYLVFFFFPQTSTGKSARLAFDLKAMSKDEAALVEVGLTKNDPNIRDSIEWDPARPFFSAVEMEEVFIDGPDVVPTTPSSTTPTIATTTAGTTPTVAASATPATTPTVAASSTAKA